MHISQHELVLQLFTAEQESCFPFSLICLWYFNYNLIEFTCLVET